ncbi:hypothetical protein, partial [Actinacidiphila glaucinigra]|uniref:hypothetical protein n=1 Tax=Actinacidiphila glaucinigra TaxID=235986 RepID=UPI003715F58B
SERMDGVSTYLALTFGTLLSSQGTEASFETVSPAPPGFPFVVSNLTRSVSRFRSSFPAPCWSGVLSSGFRLSTFETLSDSFGSDYRPGFASMNSDTKDHSESFF